MVNIGEIWWKLGSWIMVYTHWRSATNHLGKKLKNPPSFKKFPNNPIFADFFQNKTTETPNPIIFKWSRRLSAKREGLAGCSSDIKETCQDDTAQVSSHTIGRVYFLNLKNGRKKVNKSRQQLCVNHKDLWLFYKTTNLSGKYGSCKCLLKILQILWTEFKLYLYISVCLSVFPQSWRSTFSPLYELYDVLDHPNQIFSESLWHSISIIYWPTNNPPITLPDPPDPPKNLPNLILYPLLRSLLRSS